MLRATRKYRLPQIHGCAIYITQTTASGWIPYFAGTETGLHFGFDPIWNLGCAMSFDLTPEVLAIISKAITERNRVLLLLKADAHLEIRLAKDFLTKEIHNIAFGRPAQ